MRRSKVRKRIQARATRAVLSKVTRAIAAPELAVLTEEEACRRCLSDPDYKKEAKRRLALYQACRASVEFRESERDKCAADVVYFLRHYGWTFQPKRAVGAKTTPFVPFEKQVEFLRWLEGLESKGEEGVVEKSRDVGLTWLITVFFVHRWLFKDEWAGLVVSRTREEVDALGDDQTVMQKMRRFIAALPDWLRPRGYKESVHAPRYRIMNPETGATITGRGGKNAGRGGRSSMVFVDEAAFIEHAEEVDKALSENADFKIWGSTPNGVGNVFYRKRHGGNLSVFTIHWRDDGRKNRWVVKNPDGSVFAEGRGEPVDGAVYPWYESRCRRFNYDRALIAQELDISYTASIENVVIEHEWCLAAQKIRLTPKGGRATGVDVGGGGHNANVSVHRHGPVVYKIEQSSERNTTKRAFFLVDVMRANRQKTMVIDVVGVGLGVVSSLEVMAEQERLGFDVVPFSSGDRPPETVWGDDRDAETEGLNAGEDADDVGLRTSREMFADIRSEAWWKLRRRFEKTFEHFHGIKEYPEDELIQIPEDAHDLVNELTRPTYDRQGNGGKLKVESKKDMKKRGVESPHIADGLVMAFYEAPPTGWGRDPRLIRVLLGKHDESDEDETADC